MNFSKYIILSFLSLLPNLSWAQKKVVKRVKPKTVQVTAKVSNESNNHPPMNSPIVRILKRIDYAEILQDCILIPNCATECDDDGTIPVDETEYTHVINVIRKDVIGANSLEDELDSPLKKKHFLESDEGKSDLEFLLAERDCILNHDYFIEADFNSQFDLDKQCFSFCVENPNDYDLLIKSGDSHFDNLDYVFTTPIISEDLAYQIETNKVKTFLIGNFSEKVSEEYSPKLILIPKKLYLAKVKDGQILYEYEFKEVEEINTSSIEDNSEIVEQSIVEEQPQYPGGDMAILKDLFSNFVYPTIAQEQGIQGRVSIKFVIEKDGSIGETKVEKSLSPECDKAAISAIKKLKKFVPGKQNGKPVRVWYRLPIRFRLS